MKGYSKFKIFSLNLQWQYSQDLGLHATFDTNTASTVSELELCTKRTDNTEGQGPSDRFMKKAAALLEARARARAGAGAGAGSGAEPEQHDSERDNAGDAAATAATVRIFLDVLHSGTSEADQWLQELEEEDLIEELAAVLDDFEFDENNLNHDAAVEEAQKELCEEDVATLEGAKAASLLNEAGLGGGRA